MIYTYKYAQRDLRDYFIEDIIILNYKYNINLYFINYIKYK